MRKLSTNLNNNYIYKKKRKINLFPSNSLLAHHLFFFHPISTSLSCLYFKLLLFSKQINQHYLLTKTTVVATSLLQVTTSHSKTKHFSLYSLFSTNPNKLFYSFFEKEIKIKVKD